MKRLHEKRQVSRLHQEPKTAPQNAKHAELSAQYRPWFTRQLLNASSPLNAALLMLFISISDSTVCNAVPTRKSSRAISLLINAAEVFSHLASKMWKILGAENILS